MAEPAPIPVEESGVGGRTGKMKDHADMLLGRGVAQHGDAGHFGLHDNRITGVEID